MIDWKDHETKLDVPKIKRFQLYFQYVRALLICCNYENVSKFKPGDLVAPKKEELGRQLMAILGKLQTSDNILSGEVSLPREEVFSPLQIANNDDDSLQLQLQTANNEITSLRLQLQDKTQLIADLVRKEISNNQVRRELQNRIIQIQGNIRVFIRVRPTPELTANLTGSPPPTIQSIRPTTTCGESTAIRTAELAKMDTDGTIFRFPSITESINSNCTMNPNAYHDITKEPIEIVEPPDKDDPSKKRRTHKYLFDRVFSEAHTQGDIWEGTCPLVQSFIDGSNVCILTYGQVSESFDLDQFYSYYF